MSFIICSSSVKVVTGSIGCVVVLHSLCPLESIEECCNRDLVVLRIYEKQSEDEEQVRQLTIRAAISVNLYICSAHFVD